MPPHRPTAAALALAFAALAPALAQEVPPKPDGKWRGTAGAALSASAGNTESSALQLKADLARLTDADKITLGGNTHYARGKVDGERTTTANKLGVFGQYDYNLSERLFSFGKLALDRNEVTSLDLRSALGAGLGWKVIDTDALRFSLLGGLGYTVDRYDSPQTIDGQTATRFARPSALLAEESQHRFSETTTFKQRLEVQPSLGGDRATLVKFTADLGLAINSSMSLTVGLIDTYDSNPPDGQKKNDVSLFTGLNMRLGAP